MAADGPDDRATPEPTWGVAELHRTISSLLKELFPSEIWVEGEIRNLNRSKNGHVYFDLIDSDQAQESYPPSLSVTLFDRERQLVNRFLKDQGGNIRISDGVRVRIRGRLGSYPSRSSLQLRMTAIDPDFTLGVLEKMRQQVLASLEADNLLDRNATTFLTPAPTRIAMITSVGSAAHADAVREFSDSHLGIEVLVFDARVQGAQAGESLAAALRAADAYRADDGRGVDLVLVVRGGGARSDLAAFDLEMVARAIAMTSVPVLTGIGHEIDSSIADRVAFGSFKTPTAAAAGVCEMVRSALDHVEGSWGMVSTLATGHLDHASGYVERASMELTRLTSHHLNARSLRLSTIVHRVRFATVTQLDRTQHGLDERLRRTRTGSQRCLENHSSRLDGLDRLIRARDPRLALARGWSITRAADGHVITDVRHVVVGDVVRIELATGTIEAVVRGLQPSGDEHMESRNPAGVLATIPRGVTRPGTRGENQSGGDGQ